MDRACPDKLSGVDMRSVLRRTRLPLVVSLFLAALLGAPTATGPVADPLPMPITAAVAAAPTDSAPAPALVDELRPEPPAVPAAPARRFPADSPVLADQASIAAGAPRAPPHTA